MNHLNYTLLFKQIHSGKSYNQLKAAREDIVDTLQCNSDKLNSDPYIIKLYAELDVVREMMDKIDTSMDKIRKYGRTYK